MDSKEIGRIKSALANAFEGSDLGELATFLGLEMKQDRIHRILTLSQHQYLDRILNCHGMRDARPCFTTVVPHTHRHWVATKQTSISETTDISMEEYQSAVGSLMYAILGTQPDVAYAVGLVSQFNDAPKPEHWIAVKRIFCY